MDARTDAGQWSITISRPEHVVLRRAKIKALPTKQIVYYSKQLNLCFIENIVAKGDKEGQKMEYKV